MGTCKNVYRFLLLRLFPEKRNENPLKIRFCFYNLNAVSEHIFFKIKIKTFVYIHVILTHVNNDINLIYK